MAPGGTVDQPIVSTVGDGLGTMAGTSVAAAYAVGQIANVWAANPGLSYQQVIDIIKATARDIDLPGWDAETGAGILDVNAAIDLAQKTDSQIYDPPATILPESWTGEGVVLPLERAANYSTDFTGRIMSSIGANVREAPTTASRIIGSRAFNSAVKFTRWTYGDRVTDIALGTPDERWYYDAEKGGWIASAIVDGNAPGSTALRPIALPKTDPITQPIIPIDTNSAFYQNGRNNPFAYNWIGQCTWYAYGRMLETGLLPTGVKANGLFLGNAEAWRRDAARAGLAVNSSPTPGTRGLVVWPPGVQGGNRQYGHVAFLEEVLADGRIRISESNWAGKKVGDRILTASQYAGLAFIPLENARVNPQFRSPQAKPGQQREYRVRSGDTLSGIALRELGNADRWREIVKADGTKFTEAEARRLSVGLSIYFPTSYISGTGKSSSVAPLSTPEVVEYDPSDLDFSTEYLEEFSEKDDSQSIKNLSSQEKLNRLIDRVKEYSSEYVKEIGEEAIRDVVSSFNEIIDDLKRLPNVNWLGLGQKIFNFVAAKVLGRTPIGRAVLIAGGDKKPTEILQGIFDYVKTSFTNPVEALQQANQLLSDATKAIGDIWNSINKLIDDSKNLQSRIDEAQTAANLDKVAEVFVEFSVSQVLNTAANLLAGKSKLVNSKWKNGLVKPVVLPKIKMNLRHIFSGEIKRRPGKEPKPVGYHTAFSISEGGSVRPKLGKVNQTSTQYKGVYQADIELIDKKTGLSYTKTSTFFPDAWNRIKVTDEIRAAYQDALLNNKIQPNGGWTGVSASGYKIRGYVTNGIINTAYPLLE